MMDETSNVKRWMIIRWKKRPSGLQHARMEDLSDPDPILVGMRLEALREAVGIEDKKEFSWSFGLDNSTYTKVAAGKKPLQSHYAYRAAKRYGVTMDYFFFGDLSKIEPTLRQAIMKNLGGQKR